jgi:hypothetical protein
MKVILDILPEIDKADGCSEQSGMHGLYVPGTARSLSATNSWFG